MPYNPNKHDRKSTRMPGWDYARGGKYSVTIVTKQRICCFGDVVNDKMVLNAMGKIANDFWLKIPEHFDDTWLDEHIVMPNHIHGIVVMKRSHLKNDVNGTIENIGTECDERNERNVRNVGTPKLGVPTFRDQNPDQIPESTIQNWAPGALGVIINQFKRICTIEFKYRGFDWNGWHVRFNDRIIRDDRHLKNVRNYIRNNPKNWNNDEFYS